MTAPTATLLTLCIIISTFFSANSSDTPNGLTIKLIHRYNSLDSPFYRPNLTSIEKIRTLVSKSRNRFKSWNRSVVGARTFLHHEAEFLAEIGIGKSVNSITPLKKYFLDIDTGSSDTWIQCAGCNAPGKHCFYQRDGPYEPSRSISYKKLPCAGPNSHRLCNPNDCIDGFCAYRDRYLDGASTMGFLSLEDFTFESFSGQKDVVSGLVFGCGIDNVGINYAPEGIVAGMLGLGWGERSFVAQLGPRSDGNFSYCFHNQNGGLTTYLTFGANIPRPTNVLRSIPMVRVGIKNQYYVNLIGISVAGTPLNLARRDFVVRSDGSGGCIVDTGTSFTRLVGRGYQALTQYLTNYFNRLGGLRRVDKQREESFDFCYERITRGSRGFNNLPKITFYFEGGAALNVEPSAGFVFGTTSSGNKFVCLAMFEDPANYVSIIGVYQQVNHRFVYSTKTNQLFFGPENCVR